MSSSPSTLLQVELQGANDNIGTWHIPLNTALELHDQAIAGTVSKALVGTDITLTDTQYAANESRMNTVIITGTATASIAIIAPDRKKEYNIVMDGDEGAYTITFKPTGGAGIILRKGFRYTVQLDGAGGLYLISQNNLPYAVASGTDTYTATITKAPTAYYAGMSVKIKFTNANTTVATLNLNSLGAASIKKEGSAALAAGDIRAGAVLDLTHDGTNFVIGGLYISPLDEGQAALFADAMG